MPESHNPQPYATNITAENKEMSLTMLADANGKYECS